jgi:hypothetical protein
VVVTVPLAGAALALAGAPRPARVKGAASSGGIESDNEANDGVRMVGPVITTCGKTIAIVAVDEDKNHLFSWIGTQHTSSRPRSSRTRPPMTDSPRRFAYFPFGNNYVRYRQLGQYRLLVQHYLLGQVAGADRRIRV